MPQLARLQVSIFWSLFVSSTTLAGRLGPCRLCRFDGKPDLLAELAEAAAIFNLSIKQSRCLWARCLGLPASVGKCTAPALRAGAL